MTVKTAISIKQPLLERIDDAAQRLKISRSAFVARAAEELVSKFENRRLLERLDEAYADAPDEDESRLQRDMRRMASRTIGSEP